MNKLVICVVGLGIIAAGVSGHLNDATLHKLELSFRSDSYRDGYNQVDNRRDNWTDDDKKGMRDAETGSIFSVSPTALCRIAMGKWQINPPVISDWLDGCSTALHDDLGM